MSFDNVGIATIGRNDFEINFWGHKVRLRIEWKMVIWGKKVGNCDCEENKQKTNK